MRVRNACRHHGTNARRGAALRRALGVGLVEVALGLGVMAGALTMLNQLGGEASTQTRAIAAGTRLEQVYQAAQAYVRTNQGALAAAIPVGAAPATIYAGPTTPGGADPGSTVAGLPSLRGGGYLPASFIDRDSYGHGHAVLVRQTTTGTLDVLVTAYTPSGTPRLMRDGDLGRVAQRLGANGGFVLSTALPGVPAGTIQGTGGGWRMSVADWAGAARTPSAGHPVATFALNQASGLTDFLYRNAIPGVPEANTMHTAIDMGGTTGANDINRVRDLDVRRIHNAVAGAPVLIDDNLSVNGSAALCASGAANCAVTVGATGGGQSAGRFESINNGWMYFTAQGTGVAGANGGLAINQVSPGNGGNLWIGGTTYAQGPVNASSTITAADTITAQNGVRVTGDWVRVYGNRGLYFEDMGGGLHMADANWIRTYGGAGLLTVGANGVYAAGGPVRSDTHMSAPRYYDSQDQNFYVDPNGVSRMGTINANRVGTSGFSGSSGYPAGWGGGVHTWDLYAEGSVGVGTGGSIATTFDRFGNGLVGNELTVGGGVNAGGVIRTAAVFNVGTACAQNGGIAQNASDGGMLWCQGGTWQSPTTPFTNIRNHWGGWDYTGAHCNNESRTWFVNVTGLNAPGWNGRNYVSMAVWNPGTGANINTVSGSGSGASGGWSAGDASAPVPPGWCFSAISNNALGGGNGYTLTIWH